jgi:hypothetical protein
MSYFYEKLWGITRQYWWVFLFSLLSGFAGFFLAKKIYEPSFDVQEKINSVGRDYQKKIDEILLAEKEAEKAHFEHIEELNNELEKARDQYDVAVAQLEINKKKVYNDVLKKYNDNPEGLAEKFSEVSGIRLVK